MIPMRLIGQLDRRLWWLPLAIYWTGWAGIAVMGVMLVGCSSWTPEAQETTQQVFRDLLASGQITDAQYQALIQSAEQIRTGSIPWTELGATAGASILASFLGITGYIRKTRGPGTPEAKEVLAHMAPGSLESALAAQRPKA